MAAAVTAPAPERTPNLPDALLRREAVESVLGTMAAENEIPSAETLCDFERYVQGEIQLLELTSLMRRRALSQP